MEFPEAREQQVEDTFVTYWAGTDDVEGLVDAVSEAIRRRRPQLAMRLLGLLDGSSDYDIGDELRSLKRRTSLFVVDSRVQATDDWDALADMAGNLRSIIMDRARRRTRRSLRSDAGDMLGLFRGTTRRRR